MAHPGALFNSAGNAWTGNAAGLRNHQRESGPEGIHPKCDSLSHRTPRAWQESSFR